MAVSVLSAGGITPRTGDAQVPKREHIDTKYQGRYAYRVSVEYSGKHWEWEADRLPTFVGELALITPVDEGRATTRDAAIAAVQAARRNVMHKNENLDTKVSCSDMVFALMEASSRKEGHVSALRFLETGIPSALQGGGAVDFRGRGMARGIVADPPVSGRYDICLTLRNETRRGLLPDSLHVFNRLRPPWRQRLNLHDQTFR